MSLIHLTPERIILAEAFNADFHAARMGALATLPENPFGVEVWRFGSGAGVACKVRSSLLRGKNRIQAFDGESVDLLEDLLDFYCRDRLRCSLSVPYGAMTSALFQKLTEAGLWSAGSGTVPALALHYASGVPAPSCPPGISVRLSPPQEKELYLDLFQRAFADRSEGQSESYRLFQWAEDSLPGGQRYIAEIDGQAVGMASLPIVGKVAFFGTAGVLAEFRGRGIQLALIRQRIADASQIGCELVLGGGSCGTTTYRNFERAGLHLIPTGMTWSDSRV